MYLFGVFILGLVSLQAFSGLADLLGEQETNSTLNKRYLVTVNFDPSVNMADQQVFNTAFQDMQLLANAAANYDFSNTAGNIDGIYRRYLPQGFESRVQAMFRYLAGISSNLGWSTVNSARFQSNNHKTIQPS